MEIVYLLVALSLVFVAGVVAAILWAMRNDQFSDLERHGHDVLFDDDAPVSDARGERDDRAEDPR